MMDDSSPIQFISVDCANYCNGGSGFRAMKDLNGYLGTLSHGVMADFEGCLQSVTRCDSFPTEIEIRGLPHILMQGVFTSKSTLQEVESKHNPLRTVADWG